METSLLKLEHTYECTYTQNASQGKALCLTELAIIFTRMILIDIWNLSGAMKLTGNQEL